MPDVSLVLLRGLLPDLPLSPGALVSGKVVDARTLLLHGVRLQAQLPDGVAPGQLLRLRVEESGPERLHLRIVERRPAADEAAPQAAAPPPLAAFALALPGGASARLLVDPDDAAESGRGGGRRRSLVVRYDSPTLGRLDVRLDVAAGSAAVHVAAGEPAERVRAAADVLREALSRVRGTAVQVTVHPRSDTLDVRV